MTVSAESYSITYSGNGTTTAFSVPWMIYNDSDVSVWVYNDTTKAVSLKVLNTDYTISGEGTATVTLTMATAPASGERLVIKRALRAVQEYNLTTGGPFLAKTHERAFDRVAMNLQAVKEQLSRCVKVPVTLGSVDGTIASASDIDGRVLQINSSGNGWELGADASEIAAAAAHAAAAAAAVAGVDNIFKNARALGEAVTPNPLSVATVAIPSDEYDDMGVTLAQAGYNRTALNSALDTARAAGVSAVYFPAGGYVVDGPLNISGLYVFGDGPGKTVLKLHSGVFPTGYTGTPTNPFTEWGGFSGTITGAEGLLYARATSFSSLGRIKANADPGDLAGLVFDDVATRVVRGSAVVVASRVVKLVIKSWSGSGPQVGDVITGTTCAGGATVLSLDDPGGTNYMYVRAHIGTVGQYFSDGNACSWTGGTSGTFTVELAGTDVGFEGDSRVGVAGEIVIVKHASESGGDTVVETESPLKWGYLNGIDDAYLITGHQRCGVSGMTIVGAGLNVKDTGVETGIPTGYVSPSAIAMIGAVAPIISDVEVVGWHQAGIDLTLCVGATLVNARTSFTYTYDDHNGYNYGVRQTSCTDTRIIGCNLHGGRHGHTSGSEAYITGRPGICDSGALISGCVVSSTGNQPSTGWHSTSALWSVVGCKLLNGALVAGHGFLMSGCDVYGNEESRAVVGLKLATPSGVFSGCRFTAPRSALVDGGLVQVRLGNGSKLGWCHKPGTMLFSGCQFIVTKGLNSNPPSCLVIDDDTGCNLINDASTATLLTRPAARFVVDGCSFYNEVTESEASGGFESTLIRTTTGVGTGRADFVIKNCSGVGGTIALKTASCRDVEVSGNSINAAATLGYDRTYGIGIEVGGSGRIIVRNNTILNTEAGGIIVFTPSTLRPVAITGNFIDRYNSLALTTSSYVDSAIAVYDDSAVSGYVSVVVADNIIGTPVNTGSSVYSVFIYGAQAGRVVNVHRGANHCVDTTGPATDPIDNDKGFGFQAGTYYAEYRSTLQGPVTLKTADYTLTEAMSGRTYTNAGASGAVIFTLPPAKAGLRYTFVVMAAHNLVVDAQAGDTFYSNAVAGTAGGTATANAVGEVFDIVATDANTWIAVVTIGTWTLS